MIQLVSKETYYKNNPELRESPEYNFFCLWKKRLKEEDNSESTFEELYNLYEGIYYWKKENFWFVTKIEYCSDLSVLIPKKYDLKVEDILSDTIDYSNWWFEEISKEIPKECTVNKFHLSTLYLSEDWKEGDPLSNGTYSLNSSDGDVIKFSYLIEPHSWGNDSYIYTKEKETFPYDKKEVNLVTTYIEVIINWKRKQLSKQ